MYLIKYKNFVYRRAASKFILDVKYEGPSDKLDSIIERIVGRPNMSRLEVGNRCILTFEFRNKVDLVHADRKLNLAKDVDKLPSDVEIISSEPDPKKIVSPKKVYRISSVQLMGLYNTTKDASVKIHDPKCGMLNSAGRKK